MKRITLSKAIKQADALCENRYDNETKIRWISNLDFEVADKIINKSKNGKDFQFNGYDENTPGETELLVPEPFAEVYIFWIHSQIARFDNDEARYQSSAAAYYNAFQSYAEYFNRENEPVEYTINVF